MLTDLIEDQNYTHRKTGGVYRLICLGKNEADGSDVVIYQNVNDLEVWVRSKDEFMDGRFVEVSHAVCSRETGNA